MNPFYSQCIPNNQAPTSTQISGPTPSLYPTLSPSPSSFTPSINSSPGPSTPSSILAPSTTPSSPNPVTASSPTISDYGQCGGLSWSGGTNCGPGYYCSVVNQFYSQCVPNNQAPTPMQSSPTAPSWLPSSNPSSSTPSINSSPSPSTPSSILAPSTTPPSPTSVTASSPTISDYSQCGGLSWSGGTNCGPGYYCSVVNQYYSQCVPNNQASTQAPTPTPTPSLYLTNPSATISSPTISSPTSPTNLFACLSASNLQFYSSAMNPGNGYASYTWLQTGSQ